MTGRKVILGLGLVTIYIFLIAHVLYGFDAKQLEQFRKTNKCQKCDLSNAKLANLDLSYADLSSATSPERTFPPQPCTVQTSAELFSSIQICRMQTCTKPICPRQT